MAGYINYERSCNSQKCINNYIVPKGMIDQDLIIRMLNTKASALQKANVDIEKVQKVPAVIWKELATYSAWHHTGGDYRKTPHFDLVKTAQRINQLSHDDFNELSLKLALDKDYIKQVASQELPVKKQTNAEIRVAVSKREQANKIAKARLNVSDAKKIYDQASNKEKKMFEAYKKASYAMQIEECAKKLEKASAKKDAAREAYDDALDFLEQLQDKYDEINQVKNPVKRKKQKITCIEEVDLAIYEEVKANFQKTHPYDAIINAKRNMQRAKRKFKAAVNEAENIKQEYDAAVINGQQASELKRAYDVVVKKIDKFEQTYLKTEGKLRNVKDARKIAVMNSFYKQEAKAKK